MNPLVYAFWHRPRERDGYEEALIRFQAVLWGAGHSFLLGCASHRVRGLPWLDGEDGYEDWYLVDGFAGLGALNEAAIAPGIRSDHDRVALAAAWGREACTRSFRARRRCESPPSHGSPNQAACRMRTSTRPCLPCRACSGGSWCWARPPSSARWARSSGASWRGGPRSASTGSWSKSRPCSGCYHSCHHEHAQAWGIA